MEKIIENGLIHIEEKGKIESIRPVSGGDINETFYVRSKENEYFVKLNRDVRLSFFEFEANGLMQIRDTNTVHVPNVYGVFLDEGSKIPMLWMEWVEGNERRDTERILGERLAALHLTEGSGYGYEGESYIGKLQIENKVLDNWVAYYRDVRLRNQLRVGRIFGTIKGRREKQLVRLMERLDEWIPEHPKSSLLHGDLWGGNWICGKEGMPYLIDPSVFRGDHEFELAFTELFGGFSSQFYQAYTSIYPLSDEYESRKALYQLYYLLVHLNLFGETYGPSVDRILKKYV